MGAVDSRVWMEHLNVPECWRLLALVGIGRLGVLVDGAPEIYPVNHVVDEHTIVFRTAEGTKLGSLDRSPMVCYEADGANFEDRTGWSVLVKGRAVVLSGTDELHHAAGLPLRFWALGDKPYWVRIVPTEVTGRRIGRL